MRYVQQTKLSPPGGDCFQACVASILELDLDQVPAFMQMDDWELRAQMTDEWLEKNGVVWWRKFGDWLASRGLGVIQLGKYDPKNPPFAWWMSPNKPFYGIGTVDSPRGDWDHCVVFDLRHLIVAWDPYPGAPTGHQVPVTEIKCMEIIVGPLIVPEVETVNKKEKSE